MIFEYSNIVCFCLRPNWHGGMSAEELQSLERQDFLEWRRSLAELQDVENITITPFEKNLDFWRQLWRVIERRYNECLVYSIRMVCV